MRDLLIVVLVLLATGCASGGATPKPFPRPANHPEAPPAALPNNDVAPSVTPTARAGGYEISSTALSLRGTPYRNGGADTGGFDCSGFVWYVFGRHGIVLGRTVTEQYRAGGEIAPSDLQEGDLVFFSTTTAGATHVGIVVGGDSFIHAPAATGVVRVEHLSSSYWAPRFVGARRVTP
jgi:cell wall-associated NlpC family hydrolase